MGNFLDFADGLHSTHVFMSETLTDAERSAIIARQRDFHDANKANIYIANKGDYGSRSVTPWLGTVQQQRQEPDGPESLGNVRRLRPDF